MQKKIQIFWTSCRCLLADAQLIHAGQGGYDGTDTLHNLKLQVEILCLLILSLQKSVRGVTARNLKFSARPSAKQSASLWSTQKLLYIFLDQIFYRLVNRTISAFHECNSRSFLHPCNPFNRLLTAIVLTEIHFVQKNANIFAVVTESKFRFIFWRHYWMAVTWQTELTLCVRTIICMSFGIWVVTWRWFFQKA